MHAFHYSRILGWFSAVTMLAATGCAAFAIFTNMLQGSHAISLWLTQAWPALAGFVIHQIVLQLQPIDPDAHYRCHCGYDLRATPVRCPECGDRVQIDPIPAPAI